MTFSSFFSDHLGSVHVFDKLWWPQKNKKSTFAEVTNLEYHLQPLHLQHPVRLSVCLHLCAPMGLPGQRDGSPRRGGQVPRCQQVSRCFLGLFVSYCGSCLSSPAAWASCCPAASPGGSGTGGAGPGGSKGLRITMEKRQANSHV